MKYKYDIVDNNIQVTQENPTTCDHTVGQWRRVQGVCDKCEKYINDWKPQKK